MQIYSVNTTASQKVVILMERTFLISEAQWMSYQENIINRRMK